MRILAVDDDPTARAVLVAALRSAGHDVTEASDGAEGLRLATASPFQIVVSDWMMPVADGLSLTRGLRVGAGDKYVYVILLTSVEGRESWLQAMDAGVDDFLPKPVDGAVLRARLRVAERILGLMDRNRTLARFIPICMYCKKARADRDFWLDLDRYLAETGDAKLSHGVCPDCNQRHVVPMIEALDREPPPRT